MKRFEGIGIAIDTARGEDVDVGEEERAEEGRERRVLRRERDEVEERLRVFGDGETRRRRRGGERSDVREKEWVRIGGEEKWREGCAGLGQAHDIGVRDWRRRRGGAHDCVDLVCFSLSNSLPL